jgi:outer membrane protein assembly factor BamD (BamD/ComL family)
VRRAWILALPLLACQPVATPPPRSAQAAQTAMDDAARREKAGDLAGAARQYEAVRAESPRMAARALVRAAQAHDRAGEPDLALAAAWRAVDGYPDSEGARDGVRIAHRIAKKRGGSLLATFRRAALDRAARLGKLDVADALVFGAAEAAVELGDAQTGRREYEAFASRFPASGLYDDALWLAAGIARGAGDFAGAIADLERIVDTKRTALIVGSFDLQHLHEAALEIGKIELEDRKDARAAIKAFERLRDKLGESRERDDAQWWISVAYERLGDRPSACAALDRLAREYPGSRHLRRGNEKDARQRLGCTMGAAR